MAMQPNEYESPFSSRYASREMASLFSAQRRATLYRKLWLALASAEKQLGLAITEKQLEEMRQNLESIPFDKIRAYEMRFRHDVMAHIHAFGDQCPHAKPILHLGATSTYVTDNADLIQLKEALDLLLQKLSLAIRALAAFAARHAEDPCLGYTHYQPAQPTTVGKRACLWLQDLLTDALEWERLFRALPFLGAKGATGTQASFLALFDGDEEKVLRLEKLIAQEFGFQEIVPICGQTYPRKIDLQILHALSSFAAGVHKMATDLRLLAHDGEIFEAKGNEQVGSSAMPYKRNPMYAERLCALARFLISLDQNGVHTLSVQWLERSLDDSANRRFSIPEAFLAADSILNILIPLIQNLEVDSAAAKARLEQVLPQMIMENVLMEAVKKGKSRQEIHEKLRVLSHHRHLTAESVAADPAFGLSEQEAKAQCDLKRMIGRSPAQTRSFLQGPVAAYLKRHETVSVSIPPLEI